jgi:hypothetical protein
MTHQSRIPVDPIALQMTYASECDFSFQISESPAP